MARILIVDDDDGIRAMLATVFSLHPEYELSFAVNGRECLKLIPQLKPDVVLLDISMPEMDGATTLQYIRTDPRLCCVYVIMLTAHADRETDLLVNIGANDFVGKPFDHERLMARVAVGVRDSAAQRQAFFDPLTSLFNRRMFEICLAHEQATALRCSCPLTLVIADVDYFKRVNDTFGHEVGDLVLQQMASILRTHTRTSDLAARWGGEEFVALLPATDLDGGLRVSEAIRHAVEKHTFPNVGKLTASFGVAELAGSPNDFVKRADTALYLAKANGRNRVECAPIFVLTS